MNTDVGKLNELYRNKCPNKLKKEKQSNWTKWNTYEEKREWKEKDGQKMYIEIEIWMELCDTNGMYQIYACSEHDDRVRQMHKMANSKIKKYSGYVEQWVSWANIFIVFGTRGLLISMLELFLALFLSILLHFSLHLLPVSVISARYALFSLTINTQNTKKKRFQFKHVHIGIY